MDEVSDYEMAADGSLWYCRQGVNFVANTGAVRRIAYTGTLGVGDRSRLGVTFAAPWPTPASQSVEFAYTLPAATRAEFAIFDLAGRRVVTIEPHGPRAAGPHRLQWDGRRAQGAHVAAGVYLARLITPDATFVRRVLFTR